ncbi:MAG: hypothetical protein AAF797_11980 [Planctomycetota bacterium]
MRHPKPATAALFALLTLCLAVPGCGDADDSYTDSHADAESTPGTGMALTAKALVPIDADRLKPALRADVDPAVVEKLIAKHTQLARTYLDSSETLGVENTPESLKAFLAAVQNDLASPEQTEVLIHAATGAELAAYAPNTPAYRFAGGAQDVAQQILNPTTTFYSISYVEPGQDRGMRLDLLYWDGQQWSILIKPWRGILD